MTESKGKHINLYSFFFNAVIVVVTRPEHTAREKFYREKRIGHVQKESCTTLCSFQHMSGSTSKVSMATLLWKLRLKEPLKWVYFALLFFLCVNLSSRHNITLSHCLSELVYNVYKSSPCSVISKLIEGTFIFYL